MFAMFTQLFRTLTRTINAVDHLVAAGESQAELLHETSDAYVEDARKERAAKRKAAEQALLE